MNNTGLFNRTASFWPLIAALLVVVFLTPCGAPSPARADAAQPNHQERKDNVFGTMDENMRMGRDPETGDTIMRVEPAPPPRQPESQLPPIEVRPEIQLPQKKD